MFVVYVDLAGFTSYSQRHGDDAAAELAWTFSVRAMQVGRRCGLRPIKTAGDAVIFVTSDASTACRGTLTIMERLAPVLPVALHAGVAGGRIVQTDGDLFGYPVNLAAHLVSAAKPGEILVDHATASACSKDLCFETSGTLEVGPSGQRISVFRALPADPDHRESA